MEVENMGYWEDIIYRKNKAISEIKEMLKKPVITESDIEQYEEAVMTLINIADWLETQVS